MTYLLPTPTEPEQFVISFSNKNFFGSSDGGVPFIFFLNHINSINFYCLSNPSSI